MTESPPKTRVLLVDDHPLVRRGVYAVVAAEPDLEVVGEAGGGAEALARVESLKPDIVLMDLQMPHMDGIEATREIKRQHPTTAVIVLTVNDNESFLVEAVCAGASGYVLKDAAAELLVQSIRVVTQGGTLIPESLLRRALRGVTVPHRHKPEEALPEPLSKRESEVLALLVRGFGYQDMADHMHLAKVTIKKHVQSLVAKLGVSDRTQAALKAVRIGLIDAQGELL